MSESAQREAWKSYDANEREMVEIAFGSDRLRVARPTTDAWRALRMKRPQIDHFENLPFATATPESVGLPRARSTSSGLEARRGVGTPRPGSVVPQHVPAEGRPVQ